MCGEDPSWRTGPNGRAPCICAHTSGPRPPGLPRWWGGQEAWPEVPLLHLFLSPAGTTLVPTWEPDSLTPGGAAAPPCHSLGGKAATLHIGSPRTVSEEKSADLGVVINDFDVLFSRTCSPLCVSFLRHLLRAWSCGMWGHIVCLFLSACGLSAPTSQLP